MGNVMRQEEGYFRGAKGDYALRHFCRAKGDCALRYFRRAKGDYGWNLWLAGFICLGFSTSSQAQQLHLSDRIVTHCTLESLDASGFSFEGQPNVSVDKIVRWGTWPGILKQQATWLADGSWLVGEFQIQRDGTQLEVDSNWLQVPLIELPAVRGFVVSPPASRSKWRELQSRMAAVDGGQDVVWLNNQQRVAGVIRWRAGERSDWVDRLVLENGNHQTEILLADIQAVVLSPALLGPVPEPTGITVGLTDGSLLRGCQLASSKDRLVFRVADGIQVQSLDSVADVAPSLCYLTGAPKGVQFLSDLKPASYRNLSDNALTWELGIDRDVYGKPLLLCEGFAAKGLALHSSSQVAYRWDGSAGQFLAEVQLAPPDPMAAPNLGSVNCQILVAREGKLQRQKEFQLSRNLRSPEVASVDVDIDLSNAQLIVLVVEKSDFGQYADHVFWLDARVIKRP
jgi:hypothetical protein